MNILIAAGGTGGHIYPGLSIGQKLKERYPDANIVYVGSHVGMEKNIIPKYGFPLELIRSRGFERGFSKETIDAIIGTFQSMRDAKALLKKYNPDLVIGTGGFTGATLLRQAQKMKIPTMIHEQNAYAGRSNRLTGKHASKVGVAFEEAKPYFPEGKTFVCGNPVRESFIHPDREAARKKLGLKDHEKLIIVMGGSQGAMSINKSAVDAITAFEKEKDELSKELKWIVLAGRGNDEPIKEMIVEENGSVPENVQVVAYSEDMDTLLAAADLTLARAGAMSVAEFCACSLPSILVPYPLAAGDHQTFNARVLERGGAAKLIPDDEITGEVFEKAVREILSDEEKTNEMRKCAAKLRKPDAAEQFVDEAAKLMEA